MSKCSPCDCKPTNTYAYSTRPILEMKPQSFQFQNLEAMAGLGALLDFDFRPCTLMQKEVASGVARNAPNLTPLPL